MSNFSDDEEYRKYVEERKKELKQTVINVYDEKTLIKKIFKETTIIHVYKEEFHTCSLINSALDKVRKYYPKINFFRIKADLAPTIVEKLNIKVLPYLGLFKDGYFIDSIVGLDKIGGIGFTHNNLKEYLDKSELVK